MDSRERLAIGVGSTALGAYGMYHALGLARSALYSYFDNDVRTQVNGFCGASMSADQFHQLQRTEDWKQFRSPLPNIGDKAAFKKMLGPFSMFYVATLVSGFGLDLGLSTFFKNDDLTNGPIGVAIGFTFLVSVLGRFWFFNFLKKGFVKIDNMNYYSGVCMEARRLSSYESPPRLIEPPIEALTGEITSVDSDAITAANEDADMTGAEDEDSGDDTDMSAASYEMLPAFYYGFEPFPAAI